MRGTDRRRRNERNMQNKTNRSIRTDKYRYRHFERTPWTTTPSPRRGGVVPFAKRDDCNTEANDSAISFARMSEIYLRQKKVSQLTRVTEENDDAGVAGRVRNRAGNQRVSPLGRTPAYGDTLNSTPRPSCRRPPPRNPPYGAIPAPAAIPARPPRNNIPRFHAQKNSGRMKRNTKNDNQPHENLFVPYFAN